MTSSISASDRRDELRAALSTGARRGTWRILVVAALVPVLYAGLALFQMGSWHKAEWWLRDIMELRRMFYERQLEGFPVGARKNLLVAGSGTLFGANSGSVEKAIGEPTLNLGLHAGLDLDLLFAAATPYVDAGDRVVVPLEFELYSRPKPTNLTPSNFLAFFYEYAGAIPTTHLPDILLAISPLNALEGAFDKVVATVRGQRRHPLLEGEALIEAWKSARAGTDGIEHGTYDYSTMNEHGDKLLLLGTPDDALGDMDKIRTPVTGEISPYSARILTDWRAVFAERGATMFLVWPVMLEDDHNSLTGEEYWKRLIALAADADANGQPIYCDPIYAIVPVQYRYDTSYHINAKGAEIYSQGLAACLRDIENERFDWKNADPAELAGRARDRIDDLKRPGDPLLFGYERDLRWLEDTAEWLEETWKVEGNYPEALPAERIAMAASVPDPAAGPLKPIFRSDGLDFKLLVTEPTECRLVEKLWPQLLDPVRKGDGSCAIGYWTPGAASW